MAVTRQLRSTPWTWLGPVQRGRGVHRPDNGSIADGPMQVVLARLSLLHLDALPGGYFSTGMHRPIHYAPWLLN